MRSASNIVLLYILPAFFIAVPAAGNIVEYEKLCAQAEELCEHGNYTNAIPHIEAALDLSVELYGAVSSNTAQLSQILASLYYFDDRMTKAETLLINALHTWRLLDLTNTAQFAECLNNLGEVYRVRGKYSNSAHVLERALSCRKCLFPRDNYFVIESCNNYAEVLRILGQYDKAEMVFLTGLYDGKNNITNRGIIAILQNNLAFLYRELGKYHRAEQLYSRVLTNAAALAGDERAAVYNDLAILAHDRSDFYRAKSLYETAFALYTNSFGFSNRQVSRVLKNLAGLYKSQALYADAEQYYSQALDICYTLFSSNHIRTASLLNDLAVLYRVEGKYREAEALYDTVLDIRSSVLGARHQAVGHTLNNIAQLYRYQENYRLAETNFNRAIAVLCSAVNSNHPDVAMCYNNLGELHSTCSRYVSALAYYDKAFQIFTNYFGTSNLYVASVYCNIGDVSYFQTNYVSAENAFLRSLALREHFLGNTHPLTAETRHKLALVYSRMGRYTNALDMFEKALYDYESAAVYAGEEDLAGVLRSSQRDICADYVDLLNLLFTRNLLDQQTVCEKFTVATELARARTVLDQLLRSSIRFTGGIPEADLRQEEDICFQLKALNKNIAHILSLPRNDDRNSVIRDMTLKRSALYGHHKKLLSRLEKNYPRFAVLQSPSPLSLETLTRSVLNSNEVVVSYWVNQDNLHICILGTTEKKFLVQPVSRSVLTRKVALFKKALESYDPLVNEAAFKSVSFSLYKDILEPVITNINISRYDILYVVPHDVLSTIPFEPLISDKKGNRFSELSYLFRTIPVAYIPSLQALQSIRSDIKSGRYAATEHTTAFLFGDPLYTEKQAQTAFRTRGLDSSVSLNSGVRESVNTLQHNSSDDSVTRVFKLSGQSLASIVPLDGSRTEINSISRLLRNNKYDAVAYTGLDARESTVKELNASKDLLDARFLHFATHGVLPGDISGITEPCLILSLYGDEHNDGFLRMSEIFGLSLNADLVTLSACQTGAVDADALDENLSGFAQAFFYAGTPRLTVTLWNIADKSTYHLMNNYYSALLNTGSAGHAAEALAEAKYDMLNNRKFSHPFYWAGFIALGEWH